MTYSGTLNVSESAKTNISDTVRDVVRRELDNVELTATYTPEQQSWTSSCSVSADDCGKLMCVMNYDERVAEICNQPGSRTIIGSIDSVNDANQTEFILGSQVFVRDSATLMEGALLVTDQKFPCYGAVQVDDVIRSSTIGRVLQVYEKSLYLDPEGERKTVGEFEISKAKKLQFNPQGPGVVRKPSSARLGTPTPSSTSSTSRISIPGVSRRLSSAAQIPQSPRAQIARFRLVRFRPPC